MSTQKTQEAIQSLHKRLHKAVELEFATIPPYLTAAFSIFPSANRDSFEIIHSVYMEEMLHLVLAANVLNAIGGTISFNADNVPKYPHTLEFEGQKFKGREFDVNLEKLSKSAIDTFMKIELPDYWPHQDPTYKLQADVREGDTIGDFYDQISKDLTALCKEIGEKKVFVGSESDQVGQDYYWSVGGKPIKVTNLASAQEAIKVIVEQGEGTKENPLKDGDKIIFQQDEQVPHFFKFREIWFEQKYKQTDNYLEPPTGEKMPVDWTSVYPIKSNCTSTDFKGNTFLTKLNQQFNRHFTIMLKSIEKAFNGHPKSLYPTIMNDMHQMAKIAYQMVQVPIGAAYPKENGAPSFEWIDIPGLTDKD